ncbi:UNVERIFIED_ORG: uncharacterized protein (DUF1786 family) [Buttiauxella agrestis ATCC 33320]
MGKLERGLVDLLLSFIRRVKEGKLKPDEITQDKTFTELLIDSMDFIELQIILKDNYGIDLFQKVPPKIMQMTPLSLANHLAG